MFPPLPVHNLHFLSVLVYPIPFTFFTSVFLTYIFIFPSNFLSSSISLLFLLQSLLIIFLPVDIFHFPFPPFFWYFASSFIISLPFPLFYFLSLIYSNFLPLDIFPLLFPYVSPFHRSCHFLVLSPLGLVPFVCRGLSLWWWMFGCEQLLSQEEAERPTRFTETVVPHLLSKTHSGTCELLKLITFVTFNSFQSVCRRVWQIINARCEHKTQQEGKRKRKACQIPNIHPKLLPRDMFRKDRRNRRRTGWGTHTSNPV